MIDCDADTLLMFQCLPTEPFGKPIGKFDPDTLKNIIRPAYKNYKNANYDLTLSKSMIIAFIMKTHICHKSHTDDPSNYKLNLCKLYGLKFNSKEDDSVTYHICVKSGKVYVV